MDLLEKKSLVDEYLQQNPHRLSAFSFINIFAWKNFFNFRFEVIDKNLCIFAENDLGCFLYLPPLGKTISAKAVQECFKIMGQKNKTSGMSRIENVHEQQLRFFPERVYRSFLKGYEYCYYRGDIARLKGNAFKSQRALYNYCVKNYKVRYLPFEPSMAQDCRTLYERWAKNRLHKHKDEIYRHMIEENRQVHPPVMEFYQSLGLVGRVVEVDGEVKGYTFGYPLSSAIFCVLFEIVDLEVKGLAAYIFREFCADRALSNYKFINVMDDFAMEDVKQTKLSFKPVMLFPSYSITKIS
ncbi:MAG: hypothetical protein A2787_09035 [Omnitrophica WOR_2 bacterium RIFCSPHIGHO2_01_FULL_48_9]|nr:MAG: hypothetical protein A3D10_02270 [Omnitrophica WOR_2 bacterium RIFCSPHIGHO2_02_FULL_48_11]OGX30215.1 MAG: hypothetical protein A2787_09035 [Omnitrophica WOR_2 bacterium RIFCSPHIGHO2_01_FULL_48_9]